MVTAAVAGLLSLLNTVENCRRISRRAQQAERQRQSQPVWWFGTVVALFDSRINDVTVRRAWLVLEWVTVFQQLLYHLSM